MTLDEAINMYTNNAKYIRASGDLQGYMDFRQLVEWLKELKMYREIVPKIRAEIEQRKKNSGGEPNRDLAFNVCLQIIDKYRKGARNEV